jgi:hypothetical protein
MATDTVPAQVPMPPEPPHGTSAGTNSSETPAKGFLASMVAPVEPARPTFDLSPTTGSDAQSGSGDGVLDRSAPGVSSASFRDADEAAAKDPAGEKRKAQGSIWKAWWLAGAQRWAKGGGTANKRLDLRKAKAQANQVKENRTTTFTKSGGLPVRNSVGAGGGSKGNGGKSGGDSRGKGPVNSSGNRSSGPGRGGSGGGRGPGGGTGSSGSGAGGKGKQPGSHGKGSGAKGSGSDAKGPGSKGADGAGSSGKNSAGGGKNGHGRDSNGPKPFSDKASSDKGASGKGSGSGGGSGKQVAGGKSGAAGKDGTPGGAGSSGGRSGQGGGKPSNGKTSKEQAGHSKASKATADKRTPLEKSRQTGHDDGGAARNVVDHVKAYAKGTKDGWHDKKDENGKEHARLDKAHDDHKTKPKGKDGGKNADGTPLTAVTQGQAVTITDDNKPMEDPFMAKPTPIQAKGIDAYKITLGDGFLKGSVKRSELRTFKQYEGRLDARIDGLARVADATKALAAQAHDQANECQDLAEQAKGVKGGEKTVGTLTKLADQAKVQAHEADEVHKKAAKAHDFAKAVLSNIQTRYTPLYQAVVDSDEVKPAELRFYADRGITPSSTALAA